MSSKLQISCILVGTVALLRSATSRGLVGCPFLNIFGQKARVLFEEVDLKLFSTSPFSDNLCQVCLKCIVMVIISATKRKNLSVVFCLLTGPSWHPVSPALSVISPSFHAGIPIIFQFTQHSNPFSSFFHLFYPLLLPSTSHYHG